MGQQEDGATQAATWLGIAAAAIGLLAFFGISSYDELKEAVQDDATATASPNDGDDKSACQIAVQASIDYTGNLGPMENASAARIYAAALSRAADQAATPALATAMRTNIVSLEAYAQAHDRGASFDERIALATQHQRDTNAWKQFCPQN